MTESPVTYEARDGVGWITLNRPAVLNALSTELAAALADHAETAAADRRARQVVVRGAGRAFCSGMDRTEQDARPAPRATTCLAEPGGRSARGGIAPRSPRGRSARRSSEI